MKNLLSLIFLSLFIYNGGHSQITIKLGSVNNAIPGTEVHVPLIVTGLSASGQSFIGVEVQFSFQGNIIAFASLDNAHPSTPVSQWFAGAIPGKVSANWLEPSLIPVNVDDNSTLVEFVFNYTGGQTDLIMDQSTTVFYDSTGNNLAISSFIDGSITQAQGSESSIWNGTGTWATPVNWSNGIPGDSTNAVINTGTVDLTSGGNCRNLMINGGAQLVIYPGYSLTVNGVFENNGEILVKSDSLIQGSLIVHGDIIQTGSSKMEKQVYDGLSYLFSTTSEGTTVNMISGSGSVSGFLESSNSWSALSGNDAIMPFSGYMLSSAENSVLLFDGKFLSGTNELNLQFTSQGNASAEGWNLIGNSFPSSFDADNFLTSVNTDRAVYIWDGMRFRVWNGLAGSIPGGIIPPLTGFFVRANSANPGVTLNENGRIHDFSHFEGNYTTPENVLQVEIKNFDDLSLSDEAFIQIDPSSTFNYDGNSDAFKLNNAASFPEIYIHSQDNNRLSISAIPEATEVEAGVRIPGDGTYVITAKTNTFLAERPVWLIDNELAITKDLRTEDYVFIATAGDHPERFKLVFTGLGTDDITDLQNLLISYYNGRIRINSFADFGSSVISVYDLTGRLFAQSRENLMTGSVTTVNAVPGINIVRIETRSGILHYKIYVPK